MRTSGTAGTVRERLRTLEDRLERRKSRWRPAGARRPDAKIKKFAVLPASSTAAGAPSLIAQRSGEVINLASVLGAVGLPNYAVYGATKGGARHNIQMNAIAPGWFVTEMTEAAFADPRINERLTRDIPMGRTGRIEEIGPPAAAVPGCGRRPERAPPRTQNLEREQPEIARAVSAATPSTPAPTDRWTPPPARSGREGVDLVVETAGTLEAVDAKGWEAPDQGAAGSRTAQTM